MGARDETMGRRDALRRVAGAGALGAAAWAAPAVTGVSIVPRTAQAHSHGTGTGTVIVPDPGPGETLGSDYNAGVTGGKYRIYATTPEKSLYTFVWEPAGPPELVIIYCIGLGFLSPIFIGTVPEQLKRQVTRGAVLASIDYRGPPDAWPTGVTDVKSAHGWAAATYPGVPIVYCGHSAGAHYAAHAAVEHGVPWIGLSSFYWWGGFGDEGYPYTGWAQVSRDRVFEPTPPSTPLPEADVPFAVGSPPAYLVGGDMDNIVHPSETLETVDLLTSLGVPVHHDNVDTGGTGGRMHYPWTGMNIPALDAWLDAL